MAIASTAAAMSPLVLESMGALANFLLRSTLCFGVALALARLTRRPGRRFGLWMTYLVGTLTYATYVVVQLMLGDGAARGVGAAEEVPGHLAVSAGARLLPGLWTLPATMAPHALTALDAAAAVYAGVVAGAFLSHRRKQSLLGRALLYAYDPVRELRELAENLAEAIDVKGLRLLVLPGLSSPATIGWLKPVILLPPLCEEQGFSESENILQHELHHIRRRDWLLDRLGGAIRTLLFFQPAVWLAFRQLRIERELACDQAVVGRLPEMRARYAESLVRFARLSALGPGSEKATAWGVDFAAAPGNLHSRVQAILTLPQPGARGRRMLETLGRLAALGLMAAGLPYLTIGLAFQAVAAPAVARSFGSREVARPVEHARHSGAHPAALRPESLSDAPLQTNVLAQPQFLAEALPAALESAPPAPVAHVRFQMEPAADAAEDDAQPIPQVGDGSRPTATTTPNGAARIGVPVSARSRIVGVLADAAGHLGRDRDHDHDRF